MFITLNGDSTEISEKTSITQLLASLGFESDRVAVECNLEVVPRESYSATLLADGDQVEIVHFIGGGAS
jgi:thiamine biosynthesis protein ThiS